MAAVGEDDVLARVRRRLARESLHVVLPLGSAAFDGACAESGGPRLTQLLPAGAGAIVIGDGGPDFFSRFRARPTAPDVAPLPDPLDDYTTQVIESAVADLFGPAALGSTVRVVYPFVAARPILPFQRLGQAAGLPPPGPLGIQIHPVHGPWWAYRALLIVPDALIEEAPAFASCAACPRPCVAACPGGAVQPARFLPEACTRHRNADVDCRLSCIARLRCPVGTQHRYPQDQLGFHMAASLVRPRAVAAFES